MPMPICSERAVPRSATEQPWTHLEDGEGSPHSHREGHGYPSSPWEPARRTDQLDVLRQALVVVGARVMVARWQREDLPGQTDQLDALRPALICRLPRSWDRFAPRFAMSMGPPDCQ